MSPERPFVTWKYGASLDGRIAAADGSSRWITSAESRADAHQLRADCDAVIVGSGTQQADDPHLAARHVQAGKQPLRVVVDSNARTPATARVLDDAAPTLIRSGSTPSSPSCWQPRMKSCRPTGSALATAITRSARWQVMRATALRRKRTWS